MSPTVKLNVDIHVGVGKKTRIKELFDRAGIESSRWLPLWMETSGQISSVHEE